MVSGGEVDCVTRVDGVAMLGLARLLQVDELGSRTKVFLAVLAGGDHDAPPTAVL